jgi:signal transduction histidine kinase
MLPEQAVPVIADEGRITQVIESFLANALRYSPADQPVSVHLTVGGAIVRVSVHDEGQGIPLKEQERVWERFYFTKKAVLFHELDLSFGLGLYLCRAFVERHGGSVGVQSDPGHGATFWFTLPIDDAAR